MEQQGIARHVKLLIWAAAFAVIGVINASMFANTGQAYHAVVAASCGVLALAWFVWSESVRPRGGNLPRRGPDE